MATWPHVAACREVAEQNSSSSSPQVQICFIDLDWGGQAGQVHYPAFISKAFPWPLGPITQAHDKHMLETALQKAREKRLKQQSGGTGHGGSRIGVAGTGPGVCHALGILSSKLGPRPAAHSKRSPLLPAPRLPRITCMPVRAKCGGACAPRRQQFLLGL